jgi:hypothetical protein
MPDYSDISSTALFVAYLRSKSNIPLAPAIFDALKQSHETPHLPDGIIETQLDWLAPIVESRYKSLNRAIVLNDYDSVLELASGYSGRAFELSTTISTYLDSDLCDVVTQKKAIFEQARIAPWPNNVRLLPLNVMTDRLLSAVDAGSIKPARGVAIICEGLFQYFHRDEMRHAALNILEVLLKHGGAWITPDLSTKPQYERYYKFDPNMSSVVQMRSDTTGRNLHDLGFDSVDEIEAFFTGLGFRVKRYPMMLPSADVSSTDAETYSRINEFFGSYLHLWVLSAGHSSRI